MDLENKFVQDLKNSDVIIQKMQNIAYAQNFYAALCNSELYPTDDCCVKLRDERTTFSFRRAACLVVELRELDESYMKFYCSGSETEIILGSDMDVPFLGDIAQNLEMVAMDSTSGGATDFVSEGYITPEIYKDLLSINWLVSSRNM